MDKASLIVKQSLKVRAGDEVTRRMSFYTAEESPEARELSASLSCLLRMWAALGLDWPTVKVSSILRQIQGRSTGGSTEREEAIVLRERAIQLWDESHLPKRNRAAAIAKKLNRTDRHIRDIVKKAELN